MIYVIVTMGASMQYQITSCDSLVKPNRGFNKPPLWWCFRSLEAQIGRSTCRGFSQYISRETRLRIARRAGAVQGAPTVVLPLILGDPYINLMHIYIYVYMGKLKYFTDPN